MSRLTLRECYRPDIEHGALFIATNRNYVVGNEVFMKVRSLAPGGVPTPIAERVVEAGPVGPNREPGIVVQFSSPWDSNTRRLIERLIREHDR